MKPRIFIGSSTESLAVAERVKTFFSEDYDCYLWTDGIFKSNESFIDTLMKSASLFDFGIMIFAKDDETTVRGQAFESPRDNVVFEYGLFLGRVGVDKAFIVAEKGAKIPSDLFGITHMFYETETLPNGAIIPTNSMDEGLMTMKRQMDESIKLGHLGLLPSTIIAISYFDNFIKPTADWIFENIPNIKIGNIVFKEARLKIKLPESLERDIKDSAAFFYKSMGLSQSSIDVRHRPYPIYFEAREDEGYLAIYDMPTILHGLNEAIDLYFTKGHVGKKEEQQLTEDNEMGNFRRVLQIMISRDPMCRQYVELLD